MSAARQLGRLIRLLICIHAILDCHGQRGTPRSPEQLQGGLEQFFSSVDVNRDGQIEVQEARSYLGDLQLGEQDLQCMQANVDSADQGESISETELQRHLQSLLKVQDFFRNAPYTCSSAAGSGTHAVLPQPLTLGRYGACHRRGTGWQSGSATRWACRSTWRPSGRTPSRYVR
jgi:hypothetical protein